jgi:hypothetical protein
LADELAHSVYFVISMWRRQHYRHLVILYFPRNYRAWREANGTASHCQSFSECRCGNEGFTTCLQVFGKLPHECMRNPNDVGVAAAVSAVEYQNTDGSRAFALFHSSSYGHVDEQSRVAKHWAHHFDPDVVQTMCKVDSTAADDGQ